eukprot:2049435-Prymnesium_polylepis.1
MSLGWPNRLSTGVGSTTVTLEKQLAGTICAPRLDCTGIRISAFCPWELQPGVPDVLRRQDLLRL